MFIYTYQHAGERSNLVDAKNCSARSQCARCKLQLNFIEIQNHDRKKKRMEANDFIIKEYHFHVYWNENDENGSYDWFLYVACLTDLFCSRDSERMLAMNIHDMIQERIKENVFVARILRINRVPVGPHPVGTGWPLA